MCVRGYDKREDYRGRTSRDWKLGSRKKGKTPDSWAPKQSKVADVERRLDNAIHNYIYDMSGIAEIHAGFRSEDVGRIERALQECVYSET